MVSPGELVPVQHRQDAREPQPDVPAHEFVVCGLSIGRRVQEEDVLDEGSARGGPRSARFAGLPRPAGPRMEQQMHAHVQTRLREPDPAQDAWRRRALALTGSWPRGRRLDKERLQARLLCDLERRRACPVCERAPRHAPSAASRAGRRLSYDGAVKRERRGEAESFPGRSLERRDRQTGREQARQASEVKVE
jgi:hypothetical protein